MKLTREEKRIKKSAEGGGWRLNTDPRELQKAKESAAATLKALRKDSRLNIRMSAMDLLSLRRIAAEEGLPYQTLIGSILHKYVSGRLVEKK